VISVAPSGRRGIGPFIASFTSPSAGALFLDGFGASLAAGGAIAGGCASCHLRGVFPRPGAMIGAFRGDERERGLVMSR
jgi:hypothetical protein